MSQKYFREFFRIAELFTPDRCQWYWGYVSEAGVLAQLSIQATEDPDTLKEIYTNKNTLDIGRSILSHLDVLVFLYQDFTVPATSVAKKPNLHTIQPIFNKLV